ncbi:MAG: hypothetical protein KDD53_04560, partial [Bdellovibrionales bacterium]|nr:hypothetical protein [Bdellovibrionales bacterium]
GNAYTTLLPSQFHPCSVSRELCTALAKREKLSQGCDVLPALLAKVEIYRGTKGPRASAEEMTSRFQEMTAFAEKLLDALPEADLVTFYGSAVRGIPSPNDVDLRILLKPTYLDRIASSPSFLVRSFSYAVEFMASLVPPPLMKDPIESAAAHLTSSGLADNLFGKPIEVIFNNMFFKQWASCYAEPWEVPPGAILLLESGPIVVVARGENGTLSMMFSAGTEGFDSGTKSKQKGLFGERTEIKV